MSREQFTISEELKTARHTVNRQCQRKEGKNIQVQWPQYVKLCWIFFCFVCVYIDREATRSEAVTSNNNFTRKKVSKWEHYNGVIAEFSDIWERSLFIEVNAGIHEWHWEASQYYKCSYMCELREFLSTFTNKINFRLPQQLSFFALQLSISLCLHAKKINSSFAVPFTFSFFIPFY